MYRHKFSEKNGKMKSTLEKSKNQTVKLLSFLCPLVYFASYMTRKNYSVVIAEIILSEGISNAQASLAATLSLISYGAGQVISGILGDKFKPQSIITCGLISTTLMNFAMPIAGDVRLRAVIWFINGFAQSMLWPPLVRIMAATMDKDTYNDVCVNVNVAGISGTILLYITSSAIWIKYFNWKYVFISSAIVGAIITVIWVFGFSKINRTEHLFAVKAVKEKENKAGSTLSVKSLLKSGFVFIALAIIAQGALRDGISDWVPSFIINTFNLDSSGAILKSVLIPIMSVISLKAVGIVNAKLVKNEVKGSAITYVMATVGLLGLLLCYRENQYITLGISALMTGFMHAVNFFLVCIVPARFEKYGAVSTMSGVINSLTYVGSSAATYGFGAIADKFGWNSVIIAWVATAVFGLLCCVIVIKPWRRFAIETEEAPRAV